MILYQAEAARYWTMIEKKKESVNQWELPTLELTEKPIICQSPIVADTEELSSMDSLSHVCPAESRSDVGLQNVAA